MCMIKLGWDVFCSCVHHHRIASRAYLPIPPPSPFKHTYQRKGSSSSSIDDPLDRLRGLLDRAAAATSPASVPEKEGEACDWAAACDWCERARAAARRRQAREEEEAEAAAAGVAAVAAAAAAVEA